MPRHSLRYTIGLTALFLAGWLPLALVINGGISQAQQRPGEPISCVVTVSTATTIQAVGGKCAAPPAGQSLYITDVLFSASATGIAADAFPTLKYGTGTTCGTGTTVFWGVVTAAAHTTPHQLATPFRIPPANDLCWISSTAGSKFLVLNGWIGP